MNILRYADRILQIAGSIVAPPIAGILIGGFLDDNFRTGAVFTVGLFLLGLAAGLKSLISLISEVTNEKS